MAVKQYTVLFGRGVAQICQIRHDFPGAGNKGVRPKPRIVDAINIDADGTNTSVP